LRDIIPCKPPQIRSVYIKFADVMIIRIRRRRFSAAAKIAAIDCGKRTFPMADLRGDVRDVNRRRDDAPRAELA